MILSARILTDVGSVNAFSVAQVAEFTEGDAFDLYFQLIDSTLDLTSTDHPTSTPGRRYMPPATSTLTAVVDNIDDAKKITRACTQPFSQDPSIWKLTIMSSDSIKGTSNLKLTLMEPGNTKRALVKNVLRAYPNSNI